MEFLNNASVIWFIAGFVIFLLEFIVPGLVLFFFAVGAWIVSILTLTFDISLNVQLIVFLSSSLGTLLLFRKWLQQIMWTRKSSSEIEDEFVGKTAKAETFIGPGNDGKIDFKGTSWNACSEDTIEKGETVVITGNKSIQIIVKSTKN